MKRVVFTQKGGVGKSSIAVNLAAIAAKEGRKTLLIDMDPQCNASRYLMGDAASTLIPTLADFFKKSLEFQFHPTPDTDYVHPTPFDNLFLIPSHPDIGDLQSKLESRHKIYKLRDTLNKLSGEFADIIIDTPPAYNFFSQSALIAADVCLIPFDCDEFSRQALYTLLKNLQEIQADHNAELRIEGIVVNQFQARASVPQRLVAQLTEEKLPLLQTKLSSSVKMRESHGLSLPLIHMDPNHKLSREFVELYRELQT
jgi:chromosome partitioning protein